MNHKIIDIVIPTFRPDEKLEELLKRLKKQSCPIRHIVIMNTLSDRFPKEVEQTAGVIVNHIQPETFDHGGTRDDAMNLSDADVVLYMTQDAIPADRFLVEELLKPFSDKKTAVSYARQLPNKECDIIESYTRAFNYPDKSTFKKKEDIKELGVKTFFCSNVCAAYQRDIYEKVGGFTKHTIFNEDMIYAGQAIYAGYTVAYQADAKVIHSHNYTGVQQFHRNFDLAVSQVDHPDIFFDVKSENEGIRLVKNTAIYLLKRRKIQWIAVLVYKSACKYIGYKMGRNYRRLPLWLVKICTMNTKYWANSNNN